MGGSQGGNTNFNGQMPGSPQGDGPPLGSYNQPSHTPNSGYDNNTPPATPINAPGGTDYTAWNWEQVLNGVLGMQLPDRSLISGLRWTVTDGSSEWSSLYTIFSDSGGPRGYGAFFCFLNPDLQEVGGPWDEYYNTPRGEIWQVVSSAPPNYTMIALDPRTFGTAAVALGAVEDMYLNATNFFYGKASELNSEASQFRGQAGEAFYEIVQNLYTAASTAYEEMGNSESPTSYSGRFLQSGADTTNFVLGVWQAIIAWEERLDHTPIGAIYQAIFDAGIVQQAPGGGYYIPNAENVNQFGNLLTDAAWLQVESAAKLLWLTSIQETLDTSAQSLINMLSISYLNTASILQALNQPSLNPIGSPGSGLNPGNPTNGNLNSGNLNLQLNTGDVDLKLPNLGGPGGTNGIDGVLNGIGKSLFAVGSGLDGIGGGMRGVGSSLFAVGSGLDGLGGGLNGLGGGLGGLGSGLNGRGGGAGVFNAGPGVFNGGPGLLNGGPGGGGPGGVLSGYNTSAGGPPAAQLRAALADTSATRDALERALALAPNSGPLHNQLLSALADNGAAQSALRSALAGATPVGTALQTALAANGAAQALVNRVLASGQVPRSGPLRTALQQVSGDISHAKRSLLGTLGSSVPGGDFLHAALADNGKLTSVLRHALASGQVPATGPLHDSLQAALADAGKARQALDQSLASAGTPSTNSIQQALVDNRAAQQELMKALATGQLPRTGPLRGDLQAALADSRSTSSALRQALTAAGVPAEPFPGLPGLGLTATTVQPGVASLHGLPALLSGGGAPGGGVGRGQAGPGGLAGPVSAAGLSPLTGGPVSTGRFVGSPAGLTAGTQDAQGTQGTQSAGGVPFYPPMAGMGMGMGGQQGNQERERTTWLFEDEDVWGTAPTVGPASIGRDLLDAGDEPDGDDDFAEPATGSRRAPSRQGTY
jgi:hypothetical protein